MNSAPISLRSQLEREPIHSSAPCRVDFGGTWDMPAFWLPCFHYGPTTVNIALDLRTHVFLQPYDDERIKVSSAGFDPEEYPAGRAPFNTPMGLVFAIASYFNFSGVHVQIRSDSPPRSALGGSGVVGVALVHALSKVSTRFSHQPLSRFDIVQLATRIEDSLSVSLSGYQDQAAAAFGGVNQWNWGVAGAFEREALLGKKGVDKLNESLLVCYCGTAHNSSDINSRWVESFISGVERETWLTINELTHGFGRAIRKLDLNSAIAAMIEETRLRRKLTKEVLIPITEDLVTTASETGCGARFAGAGGGGCIWAIGEPDNIVKLRKEWSTILASTECGRILDTSIDERGVE